MANLSVEGSSKGMGMEDIYQTISDQTIPRL